MVLLLLYKTLLRLLCLGGILETGFFVLMERASRSEDRFPGLRGLLKNKGGLVSLELHYSAGLGKFNGLYVVGRVCYIFSCRMT